MADFLRHLAERLREAEHERGGELRGVVVGQVVQNKDELKLGRVRVSFPTLPIEDGSAWAPLAAIGAGPDRGWSFIPEIGDEVLVGFEHGDVARPVVLGALWNGKARPARGGGEGKDVLVSRSGHTIELDDEASTITFRDGQGVAVVTIDGKAGAVTLEAKRGDVELHAPGGGLEVVAKDLTLEADRELVLHAGGAIKVGSDAAIKLSGKSSIAMKGKNIRLAPPGPAAKPSKATAKAKPVKRPL